MADSFVLAVYSVTASFPKHEQFGLTQQVRRAAVSVASNIVEGCARQSKADYLRLCDIARGSLAEALYQLSLCHRLGYLDDDALKEADTKGQEAAAALHGLMAAIRSEVSA